MKKFLSILLVLVMVVSVIPFYCVTACAESTDVCTEHSFGEWELVKRISCTNAGTKEREVRKCSKCGEKEYRFTGKWIYHDWTDWVVVREATCTLYGEEYRFCNICGDEEYRFPEATGHNFEAVVVNPTCTEQGYTEYICKCGDTYTENLVEAIGHNKNAEGICENCGENFNSTVDREPSSGLTSIFQMLVEFIEIIKSLFK